jgi:NAD(P) transhydrogenase
MGPHQHYDLVVIGAGPGGQKAAIQASKVGRRVIVVEQAAEPGGACVSHGTIPSKTLRETAVALTGFQSRSGGVFTIEEREALTIESLTARLGQVLTEHGSVIANQLRRNRVDLWQGRARFLARDTVEVRGIDGVARTLRAGAVVIATGSRPRDPSEVPVDHEHVLDSDSILSLRYLPTSLVVLGAGVIACEYASTFAALGVKVTVVDAAKRPLGFLDPEVVGNFVRAFERTGGTFRLGRRARQVVWNGADAVETTLDDGTQLRSEKLLFALGRVANVDGLGLASAGLGVGARGFIEVDDQFRTAVPGIYAVGDVIGPPALAATAMEQGRRAACHALGIPVTASGSVPIGVYTIPEIASVGLSEAEARTRPGGALVGRARFPELARGRIAGLEDGLVKLVADRDGYLLGAQIVGEGAAELVHVAQMALIGRLRIDVFVDHPMNFPTLAEAYRVAALDILNRSVAAPQPELAAHPPA